MANKAWEDIALAKKIEQLSRIPVDWRLSESQLQPKGTVDLRPYAASCGILSETELEITGEKYDATALISNLADGSFTAVEVVTAFCKRAAVAQQLCNCLTEIMFLEALEEARKLDAHFKKTGKPLGPLHGIPMTFKECFHAKGYDASDGYISRCFEPSTYDSYLIQLVRSAGAVVIAKTNVPQTMLVAEAHNNVFGQTKNPVVSHLTCGGSSGGEGSLMAFGGSAIGIGTDVAGSIRIPAAANGVYGFKPSFGLLPMLGYANSNWAGMNTGIPAVCGPITRSLRDLSLLTRVVRDQKPWLVDPSVIPYVYEGGTSSRKPCVGVIRQSGITVHPPIRRAISEAVNKLKAAGIEVKEFVPPSTFTEIRTVAAELFTIDGMSYAKRELAKAGESTVPSVNKIGFWDMPRKEPEEIWEWNAKKGVLQKEMVDAWQKESIDVVLCPAGPFTAVKPDDWRIDMYTVWVNVMDFPAVIVPYDHVDLKKDQKYEDFRAMTEVDAEIQAMYDPNEFAGAPIGLQLVGQRLQDEQLLEDAKLIDDILRS